MVHRRVVFDAQPLIAFVLGEPLRVGVRERLEALGAGHDALISAVNWCEVLYTIERRAGVHAAARAGELLQLAGVVVVDADASLASRAADLKVRYRLGIGDAFAAALSMATGAALVTADPDFLPLAQAGLTIDWLGE